MKFYTNTRARKTKCNITLNVSKHDIFYCRYCLRFKSTVKNKIILN